MNSKAQSKFLLPTACAWLIVGWLVSGCAGGANPVQAARAAALPTDEYALYELRTYTTNEGKLEALKDRFRDHTLALFAKHGIRNVAYWTPTDKPNTLIYVIAHKDKAAATKSWQAFIADPQWQAAYAASRQNGPLVTNIDSVFMQKTNFSPDF